MLFHGFVMDAHGVQMSKSKGNIVQPEEVIDKYGRDVLRLYYLSNPPWNDYYFKWEDVEKMAKSFIVIKNTFNFVKTYVVESDSPLQSGDSLRKAGLKEDMWIVSKLNTLIVSCTEQFKNFLAHKAANDIRDFILNDFSRWYVKLVRDRVWLTYEGADKQAAFHTLLGVTETLCKLLAPFCPFFAEEAYQNIVKPFRAGPESVHMCDWPEADKKVIDKKLEEQMETIKTIVEACHAARQKAKIRLRWPLDSVVVVSEDEKVANAVKELQSILQRMCNAEVVKHIAKEPSGDFACATFDLGKVFVPKQFDEKKALIRELVRKVQNMRKQHGFNVKEKVLLCLNSDEEVNAALKEHAKAIGDEVGASEVRIGELEGKYRGKLEFMDKTVEIAFQ